MNINKSYLTKNDCYIANVKKLDNRYITFQEKGASGLMLHSVGCNQPSALTFIKNWNKAGVQKCVHAFVDANSGEVYQTLPWNYRGWHAGGSANNTMIGVELAEPSCIKYTSGAKFTCSDINKAREMVTRTYNSAVELFTFLCKEYKLDPMKNIISHSEGYKKGVASGHSDPEHLWKGLGMPYTMDTFRKDVKNAMSGNVISTKDDKDLYYTVAKGDSLSKIGKTFNVKWQDIAKLNGIKFPYIIRVGQKLKIK